MKDKYLKLKIMVKDLEDEKSYLDRYYMELQKYSGNLFSRRNLNRTLNNIEELTEEIKIEKQKIIKDRKDENNE